MISTENRNKKFAGVAIFARASTPKQVEIGDTLESQMELCRNYVKTVLGLSEDHIVETFVFVESGATVKELKKFRLKFQEMIDVLIRNKHMFSYFVFKDIERLTRGGVSDYETIKKTLETIGIELRDVKNVIKPKENTLETYGLRYSWSIVSPSAYAETQEAIQAEKGRTEILTKMIGAEIRYTRKGFLMRRPPLGYTSVYKVIDGMKRKVLVPHPTEAQWIREMFKLSAEGWEEKEIVQKVNLLGFKTREISIKSADKKKIIGKTGGNILTKRALRKYIKRPIYAGIICEKYTNYKPIWAQFDGLVDLETFNRANDGKVFIEESAFGLELKKNVRKLIRLKNNPEYPFKNHVLCSLCRSPLLASASKGKSGNSFSYYHCSRNHKWIAITKKDMHDGIYEFLEDIVFEDEFIQKVENAIVKANEQLRENNTLEIESIDTTVKELEERVRQIKETLIVTSVPELKRDLEADYVEANNRLFEIKKLCNNKKAENDDIELLLKYTRFIMEHPARLVTATKDPIQKGVKFSMFFKELPTYDDLVNRTPKLSSIFKLSENQNLDEDSLVTLRGFSLNRF